MAKRPKWVVGLVGTNCAGKGVVAEALKDQGFQYLSLSDVLRKELISENLPITRDHLIQYGRRLREKHGNDYLAEKVCKVIDPNQHTVVDSIRTPAEVARLRKLPRFVMLKVDADAKLRFERMKARHREGDPDSFDEFIALEKLESDSSVEGAQQVDQSAALADHTLYNNGTVEQLENNIDQFLNQLKNKK